MIAAVLFAIAAIAPWASRRWTGDVASPIAVVVVAWAGTIGLYFLYRVPFIPVSWRTWEWIAASLALLSAGVWIGARLARGTGDVERSHVPLARVRRWVVPYAVVGLCGVAWYVWNVRSHLGWAAFADASRIRVALNDYTIPSTFLVLQYFCIAAPLVGLAIALVGQRLAAIEWIAIGLCGAGTWFTTDRTQFFTVALVGLFIYAYARVRTFSALRVFVVGALAAALLIMNFAAIARWVGKRPEHDLYVYSTGSYPAFDYALTHPQASTHGAHTFFPLVRLLQRVHLVKATVSTPILEHVVVTRPEAEPEMVQTFNAYTFLIYPYLDWGTTGMLIYAFIIGLGSGAAYGRMRRRPDDPARIMLAALVGGALTLSPFVNKFNNTGWWYVAALTLLPFLAFSRANRAKVNV